MRAPDEQLVGLVLGGRYRVTRLLAAGGMGAVYEAEHVELHHLVAIKVMHATLAEDDVSLARFEREARIVAAIGHPNVVQLYDFHRAPGELAWLAMELVPGRSLAQLLKAEGALPKERVVAIVASLLSALGAAHAAGVIHRDLKPGNVMVQDVAGIGEVVKLLDFGVAKLTAGAGYAKLTRTGVVVGTPQYMAPEQALGRAIDARTDLYAVGVIAWAMLTGRPPYGRGAVAEILEAVVSKSPPPPSTLQPSVPPALDAFVARAMAKRPEDRFQSASTMADAILDLFATGTVADTRTLVRPAAPTAATSTRIVGAPVRAPPRDASAPHAVPTPQVVPAPQEVAPPPPAPEGRAGRGLALAVGIPVGGLVLLLFGAYASLWIARAYVMTRYPTPTTASAPREITPSARRRPAIATPSVATTAPTVHRIASPTIAIAATPPSLTRVTMHAVVADALPRARAVVADAELTRVVGHCVDSHGRIAANVDETCGWTIELASADGTTTVAVSYELGTPEPYVATDHVPMIRGTERPERTPVAIAEPDALPDSDVVMGAALAIPQCAARPVGNVRTAVIYEQDADIYFAGGRYLSHGDVVAVWFGEHEAEWRWRAETRHGAIGAAFEVCN